MFEVKAAVRGEYAMVLDFYDRLTDGMEHAEFPPGWKKRVYPTEDFLRESIARGELFLGRLDGAPAGVMVLNHISTDGYARVAWNVDAPAEAVTVIHAMGVAPERQGRGLAKQLVRQAIHIARTKRQRALRLDVLGTNLPAQKLYTAMGFQYRTTLKLFYEDTGTTDYLLYELVL